MRQVGRKLAFQWGATVLVGLSAFVLQTVLARELGPRQFGLYSVALSCGGIIYVVQNAGFRALFLREDVKPTAGFAHSRQIFALAIAHTGLVTALLCAAIWIMGLISPSELTVPVILILAINAPRIVANLVAASLIAKNNFEAEAKWQLLSRVTPYALTTLAALVLGSLTSILSVSVVMTAAVLAARPDRSLPLRPVWKPDQTTYKAAIGLGLLDLVTQLYVRISTLVLYDVAVPLDAIGQYGVFQRLLEAVTMILGPLAFMFHNHVRKYGFHARETRQFGFRIVLGVLAINLIGLPIQIIYGADLLEWIFGPAYRQAAPLLPWLQLAMILMAPNMMMGQALIALNQEWAYVRFGAVIVIVSLTANLILAPRFGIHGSVQSSVIAELVLLALMVARLFWNTSSSKQQSGAS